MRSLTRQEVRRLDQLAIERAGINGLVLMENAGRGAADAIEAFLGGVKGKRIAIVAGGGNNGGDGYVVARHLGIRGAAVTTFCIAPAEKIKGDAEANLRILKAFSADVRDVSSSLAGLAADLRQYDLVVDAVGGTGVTGAIRGSMAEAVEQITAAGRPVVALDIPTGLDCDSGRAEGPAIKAVLTVTFAAPKKGFDSPGADQYTGRIVVADIGVDPAALLRLGEGDGV